MRHNTNCWPLPIMLGAAIGAGLLSGCSENLVPSGTVDPIGTSAEPLRTAATAANRIAPEEDDRRPIRERFTGAALDDRRLGEIRGGFDTSSGLVVNFSFQEARLTGA